MTTKLYWRDSHLTKFTAQVQETFLEGNRQVVILDQTAFYPAGGGQPCDIGVLNSTLVCDVKIQKDGVIYHYLENPAPLSRGDEVIGEIDWPRRQELTQQHTGQHILSQSFFQLFGAETKGFRINANSSEIDLTLDSDSDALTNRIEQAEGLANNIIFADREIQTHVVTPDAAARLPLRKESFVDDCVRVIEIADFDWSACGGTHANRTGEVGLLAIKNWERAKQMIRVEFLCGVRVLRDYRVANKTADLIARRFSVARDSSLDSVSRLIEENKDLKRKLRVLAETSTRYEVEDLRKSARLCGHIHLIVSIFEDRSYDELKMLAHKLMKLESTIVLFALKEGDIVRLVFARSANIKVEMGRLMHQACQQLGGKGGGTSDFAQGGGAKPELVEDVLGLISGQIEE